MDEVVPWYLVDQALIHTYMAIILPTTPSRDVKLGLSLTFYLDNTADEDGATRVIMSRIWAALRPMR